MFARMAKLLPVNPLRLRRDAELSRYGIDQRTMADAITIFPRVYPVARFKKVGLAVEGKMQESLPR